MFLYTNAILQFHMDNFSFWHEVVSLHFSVPLKSTTSKLVTIPNLLLFMKKNYLKIVHYIKIIQDHFRLIIK